MSNKRCTLREDDVEIILRDHGPLSLSQIAARLGVKPATASNYAQWLRQDGRAHNSGMGCNAVWYAGPPPVVVAACAITQAPSVWEYARRIGCAPATA